MFTSLFRGQEGNAKVEYSPNPNGKKGIARWTNRRGVEAFRYQGIMLGIGFRRFHQDPSF
jgi:hypothetical protein